MDQVFTIDIGNSRIKLARFDGNLLVETKVFEDLSALETYIKPWNIPIVVCSVKGSISLDCKDVYYFNATWKYPFGVNIEHLDQLGADRLAAVWAGEMKFPKCPKLIIDAGTCITYEYVDQEGTYLGGAISPGLNLRFKSMHDYTSALPELKALEGLPTKIGTNTEAAMRSGVMHGFIAEITTRIEEFKLKNEDSAVILTGGDLAFLGNTFKTGIFVEPLLLHYGLYYAYKSL